MMVTGDLWYWAATTLTSSLPRWVGTGSRLSLLAAESLRAVSGLTPPSRLEPEIRSSAWNIAHFTSYTSEDICWFLQWL